MATTTGKSTSDTQEKAVSRIERVDLYNYGYEKSGAAKGDPEIFETYLSRIANGELVEESYKGISDDEKKERREQIKELEKKQQEYETANAKFEVEIQVKEKKIDEFRQELLKIHDVRNNDQEKLKRESFSPLKFGINLFLLLMLSGYLFFFYVSTAYKALYVDFEKLANSIAQGHGAGSIMPQPYELAEAIQFNFLLFLVPFVFYAFGWAFHILLDMKQQIKIVLLSLLIALTFVVDMLLAFIIHNNIETAKDLMGLATTKWTVSANFYIILFLGFLVYIIWSLLLDSLLREWDKRNITANLKKIINHLKGDIKRLQEKIIPLDELLERLSCYREDVNTVMVGNLKKYVDEFSSGWISYLAPDNMKAVKERCLALKKSFEDKMGIKPGIVKVISKKA